MIIAQISDLHIMRPGILTPAGFDTSARLARCVEQITNLRPVPDVVLATGDLIDDGTAGEYRHLRALLAPLHMPVYLIPGNHDERGALCAEFSDHRYLPVPGRPVCYAAEDHEVRLIALDTVVPGEDGGTLDSGQLDWFEATLAAGLEKPTLVFMHHPPFRTGLRYMDEIALDGPSTSRLGQILKRHHACIERVVCGHVHRGIQVRWQGTLVSVCPSTAFQTRLDLEGSAFAASMAEPPAFQLHCWNGTELVTHTVAVSCGT